jgi:hypothetical protein
MTLIDNFRKSYAITVECTNCLQIMELSVPKGVTIEEFLGRESAKCKFCGCSTLKKIPTRKVEKEAERKELFNLKKRK